jgi:uncharacterized protein (UPF0261 family)
MPKTVLIISTLDTKGEETLYLRERVRALGLDPLLMDVSLRGGHSVDADITADRIAAAAGSTLEQIQTSRERSKITNTVIAGASRIAVERFKEGRIHGVVGLGGSTGSLMATEVMRALPFGLPKLMISSTAALPGLATRYIGTGDISLFHSVIEISGLSDLLKNVIDRAVCAMAGMVQGSITSPRREQGKALALTMLGPCEKCASAVRYALEEAGYQVIGFSAAGIGDRAMEEMISQGLFHGVIDLAPSGVGEHLYGFMRDPGPHRLESAGKVGIPQIISLCSVNYMTPAKSKYKPEYHERRKYDLDKYRTWIRLSPAELKEVAEVFVQKLNPAKGPVKIIVPLKGWCSLDVPGSPTFDLKEDAIFTQALRAGLKPEIEITEVDAHMEDPAFARAVVEASLDFF